MAGLFSLHRGTLVRNRSVIAAVTEFMLGLEIEQLTPLLPVLRRSLGNLSNAERSYLAETLEGVLGLQRALVVHGLDGLDEITITGPTRIGEGRGEWVRLYEITPEQFGLTRAPISAISGGDLHANAQIIREILDGKASSRRDVVLMNAAAALVAAGRADSLADAMPLAVKSLDSGAAKRKLAALVEFTNRNS